MVENKSYCRTSRWSEDIEIKSGLDWLSGFSSYQLEQDSSLNPNNRVLESQRFQIKSDLRGDFKLRYKSSFQFVFRPRFETNGNEIYYNDTNQVVEKVKTKSDLSEGFFDFFLSDKLTATLGLQNYQWGPAELLSPSNPIFHLNSDQKSFFFRDKGKVISRLNYNFSEQISFVVMNEFMENKDPNWIIDKTFEKKIIGKLEYRSKINSSRYVGLTGGEQEYQQKFIGSYLNYNFFDMLSIYYDLKYNRGSNAYYPTSSPYGFDVFDYSTSMKDQDHYFSIAGFRIEHDWDLRFEYIYNSAGYDKTTLQRALQSLNLNNPFFINNLIRYSSPGLELVGKNYVYSSLRLPDLGIKKDASLYLRYLHSLQDQSGSAQLSFEKALGDMVVANLEAVFNMGTSGKEFTLIERSITTAGLKLSW